MVLPTVTTKIAAAYPCTEVNPDSVQGLDGPTNFLTADFTIECYSSRYYFGVGWATLMVLVYPIGIPVRPQKFDFALNVAVVSIGSLVS